MGRACGSSRISVASWAMTTSSGAYPLARRMINAILFDLFETLVTESHSAPTRASSLGPALGLEPAAFKAEWRARRPLVTLGKLSFRDALLEISTVLTGTANREAVRLACEQRLREKRPHGNQIRLKRTLRREPVS